MSQKTRKCLKRLLAGAMLATAVASAWAADGKGVRFDIARFDIRGNTLLPQAAVDAALSPYTGSGRDVGDVQAARDALEKAYRDRGYQLVVVVLPQQELDDGVVMLRVTETRVARVAIAGNQHFDDASIRRTVPALQQGATPDMRAVSANLKQANENPSRQITLKLQGEPQGDAVDAVLDVRDESPWRVLGSVDNTGTGATGRTHIGVALQNANMFGLDHLATLQYITSLEEPGRVKVYGAGYHIPFYASGDALDLYASYSSVNAGTVNAGLFDLAVSGKGAAYGARYTQALGRWGDVDMKLAYGMDIKLFKNSVQLDGIELGNDVTVHPISLSYQASAPIRLGEVGAQVSLVRNLPGGANGDQHAFSLVRADARADYTLLRFSAAVTRAVGGDWQLRAIVNGQYTRDALVPGEQFGAGGASSVRGFVEREFANDSGAALNLEAYTPNLCARAGWNCRLLGFYDTAHLKRNNALPGELASTTIASAGVGVRFVVSNSANLQMDYGQVIKAGTAGRADNGRLHVRLALAY